MAFPSNVDFANKELDSQGHGDSYALSKCCHLAWLASWEWLHSWALMADLSTGDERRERFVRLDRESPAGSSLTHSVARHCHRHT